MRPTIPSEEQTEEQKLKRSEIKLQSFPQILMPAPKSAASPKQLELQERLVAACKQGNEKAVTALLEQGAKTDMANARGEYPLGAAVWSMCPNAVNALLKQTGGAAMTWEECKKHNLKYYQDVFIVSQFDPQTYRQWYTLLQKIDGSFFISAFHLKEVDAVWRSFDSSNWYGLKEEVRKVDDLNNGAILGGILMKAVFKTEAGYEGFRTEIQQAVETASVRPESTAFTSR